MRRFLVAASTNLKQSRWLVSKRYDLTFFIGSCVFTFFFLGLFHWAQHLGFLLNGDTILITYFFFTAIFDQPHIFQTFSRTHLDGDEFKKHRNLHTWGLLAFIAAGFVLMGFKLESELIVFASVFGSYHIIRQHYGFLRAYKGVNGDTKKIDNYIDYGLFYSCMGACFFRDFTDIKGPVTVYRELKAYYPYLPGEIATIVWVVFWIFLALFFVRQIQKVRKGLPLNLPKLLFLSAALGTHYFVFFATATPFLVAEALETAYHDVQYHGWMAHYQKSRFPKKRNLALRWFGISLLYGVVVGIIEVLGLMHRGWFMWTFVPFTMIVLYHYYVDGIVWKFSKYPELRKAMFEKK